MGFLKKLISNLNSGFFYIVDSDTFMKYLEREIEFSVKNDLSVCADLNLYLYGDKYHIRAFNNDASDYDGSETGITFFCDEYEYKSAEEMIAERFNCINGYFKIELNFGDDSWLNDYKAAHPELNADDY